MAECVIHFDFCSLLSFGCFFFKGMTHPHFRSVSPLVEVRRPVSPFLVVMLMTVLCFPFFGFSSPQKVWGTPQIGVPTINHFFSVTLMLFFGTIEPKIR